MRSRQASTAARWAAVPDGPGASAPTRAGPAASGGAASRARRRARASRSAVARALVVRGAVDAGRGGGWVGYLGYDLVRRLERLPPPPPRPAPLPAFALAFYDHVVRCAARRRALSLIHI